MNIPKIAPLLYGTISLSPFGRKLTLLFLFSSQSFVEAMSDALYCSN
jgi:hypothetical protein